MNERETTTTFSLDQGFIGSLLSDMKKHLEYFFHTLDTEEVRCLVERLFQCKGTIFITGVGKSGIIAKKVAMSLNSCGTKATFLSPLDALHGDIGQVDENDAVILFSKSGESDELLQLMPALRAKGACSIAAVSNRRSRLGSLCDYSVYLPVLKELCPYDLAPTTSPLVQLMFGDLVAIALMQMKGFSQDDFAKNHPAGRLGKRLTWKVQDLMLKGDALPITTPDTTLANALVELSNKKCGCVLILDGGRLVGIFTDGDLRRSLQKYGAALFEMPMSELMTKNPRTIAPSHLAYEAMQQMESRANSLITTLAVVEDGALVGLIRMHDIVQSGI